MTFFRVGIMQGMTRRFAIFVALLATALLAARPAPAQTFGALSNFDVFNDTGQECHGFEIELDASRPRTSSIRSVGRTSATGIRP